MCVYGDLRNEDSARIDCITWKVQRIENIQYLTGNAIPRRADFRRKIERVELNGTSKMQ